jgi:hypothetical protein
MAGEAPMADRRRAGKQMESRVHPDDLLQRVQDVRLSLTGADTVRVRTDSGGVVECGHLGLRILERFARPTSLREFAGERVVSAQEWVDLLDTARALLAHGVLVDAAAKTARSDHPQRYWWDNPRPHIEMLDDVARTQRYIEALEQTIRRGDVVVDVGTGTGVLAMAAARAGAKHVYAIEAGAIADKAEELVALNGFRDAITIVRGWSTSVTLPERADVLVTETLGSDPFNERILEIVLDARKRLLVPDARIIPEKLALYASLVEVPEPSYGDDIYTPERSARWEASYGFDFSPLSSHERWVRGLRVPMATARTWQRLASPTLLVDVDLNSIDSAAIAAERRVRTDAAGRLDGAVLHFTASLAAGITLSTDPHGQDGDRHWWNVLNLRPPLEVEAGRLVQLSYGRHSPGVEQGLTVTVPG